MVDFGYCGESGDVFDFMASDAGICGHEVWLDACCEYFDLFEWLDGFLSDGMRYGEA